MVVVRIHVRHKSRDVRSRVAHCGAPCHYSLVHARVGHVAHHGDLVADDHVEAVLSHRLLASRPLAAREVHRLTLGT